jgi:GWxTD domain-containing protein
MRIAPFVGLVAVLWLSGCTWRRVGQEGDEPSPTTSLPQLFDAAGLYREMGFFAQGGDLPFAASVRYLAGPTADSTLAVFGLSMANNGFSFGHGPNGFVARYDVEVEFRRGGTVVGRIAARDSEVVRDFKETLRSGESIVFERAVLLPPGKVNASVSVRDAEAPTIAARDERSLDVPRFGTDGLSGLLPVYSDTGRGRAGRNDLPDLALNPRGMVPYAADSLRFYLEGYGVGAGAHADVRVVAGGGTVAWQGTVPFTPRAGLATAYIAVPPDSLPVGELRVSASVSGIPDTASTPALVTLSGQWVTANLDEVLSMLRYFGYPTEIEAIKRASGAKRIELWRKFWKETDPVIVTPQNEALNEYFTRLEIANSRYREGDLAGWLTDRGRVFITLGEPSEVYDASSIVQAGQRLIRWSYTQYRISLDFEDQTGFGRFFLTPASEAAYSEVLDRIRRNGG